MKRSPLVVAVDEIRLRGFDPRRRGAIGDAIARELTHAFANRSILRGPRGAIRAGVAKAVARAVRKPC